MLTAGLRSVIGSTCVNQLFLRKMSGSGSCQSYKNNAGTGQETHQDEGVSSSGGLIRFHIQLFNNHIKQETKFLNLSQH